MDDDADAKTILTAPPSDNWKRPPGRPRITWLNIVQRDLRAYNLTLNEAVDLAQNRPPWRLMSSMALRTPSGVCQKRRRRSLAQHICGLLIQMSRCSAAWSVFLSVCWAPAHQRATQNNRADRDTVWGRGRLVSAQQINY